MFEKAEDKVDDNRLGQFSWRVTERAVGLEPTELLWWNEVLTLQELLKPFEFTDDTQRLLLVWKEAWPR